MTRARASLLKFQIGARTLAAIRRELVHVAFDLDAAIDGRLPTLPPLDTSADGYLVTSLPEGQREALARSARQMLAFTRQRYIRRYADLTLGFDAYLEQLSPNTRAAIRRKAKKVARLSGGHLDLRRFHTAPQLSDFQTIARQIALTTYQEKLLGAGLPDTAEFCLRRDALAASGHVRAWLLYVGGEPAAYLYCPILAGTALYEFVGHDPKFSALSVGAVLQAEALRDLVADPAVTRFDFSQGDGQHKRQFATAGVACCDLLLLRANPANRLAIAAFAGFDRAIALTKAAVERFGLDHIAKKVRRA